MLNKVKKGREQKIPVIRRRLELFENFTISLLYQIESTYPGEDCMNEDDNMNHYNWSYKKTCEKYNETGIDFFDNDKLCEYFWLFYNVNFYQHRDKRIDPLLKFWDEIFNYKENITKAPNINILTELYHKFNTTLVKQEKTVDITK